VLIYSFKRGRERFMLGSTNLNSLVYRHNLEWLERVWHWYK